MSFNPLQHYEFGKSRNNYEINTYIGGVSSVVTSASVLATKLRYYPSDTFFSVDDIHNFEIVGNDIKCNINANYSLINYAFDTQLTYFNDVDGLCMGYNDESIFHASNPTVLKYIILPNIPKIPPITSNFQFESTYGAHINWTTLYAPNCVDWGNFVYAENDLFRSNFSAPNLVIYTHPSMQTIYNGGLEGDLAYLLANNKVRDIRFVTNLTVPNAITDLAVDTVYATLIKLEWTEPTSTNGIDFYEVYVDGVLNRTTSNLNVTVAGLTNLQTYDFTVIAVDNFYNKSDVSNTVTQQINGSPLTIPLGNIISYYKFENNVLDSVGTNDGIVTNVTYATGKVGNAAKLSSGYIDLGSNSIVGGKSEFSVSAFVRVDANTRNPIYGSWSGVNSIIIQYNGGNLQFYTYANAQAGGTFTSWSDFTNFNHIVCTYDGSLMKMYINGVLLPTTYSQSGLILNGGQNEAWGRYLSFSGANTIDDGVIWNKELSQTEVTEIYNQQNAGLELI